MTMSKKAQSYHERMFPGYVSDFLRTDPDFIDAFDNFAFDEVVNHDDLADDIRFKCILSILLGSQAIDEFKGMLPAAMRFGVKAAEIKEIVYQGVAYLGIGRVFPFLKAVNAFLESQCIDLPLPCASTTDPENRLEKGSEAQVAIFGEGMKDFYKTGAPKKEHINEWLTSNCFGDYYTRKGLSYKEREMITFCFLYAQGGCEPQLISHAKANMRLGNDEDFLIQVVTQGIPYMGYPRSLNALRCIEEAKQ